MARWWYYRWTWRSHSQPSLYLPDCLRPKAGRSVGRAITGVGERLSNSGVGPACLGQLLDRLADLGIRTQLAQLANRADHKPLSVTSSNPLDMYPDPLAVPLYVHSDPFRQSGE